MPQSGPIMALAAAWSVAMRLRTSGVSTYCGEGGGVGLGVEGGSCLDGCLITQPARPRLHA
jgi:hypothetical protein